MHLCAALAVLTALVGTSHATSYYVATTGDDSAAGTQSAPFLTVQKCASTAAAGDACVLRGGRYPAPATVSGLAGEGAGEGLTIAGFGGEDAVIDGSMALSGDAMKWTKASASASASSTGVASCIYRSAPYDREATVPWQLFLGDRPLTPARWPNARLDDLSVFAPHNLLNGSGPLAYSAKNSTFGELVDDDTSALAHSPSLAESGIDFTGTMVVLPLGVMGADPRGCLVTRHGAGAGSLSYTPPTGSPKSLHSNNPYFFEGHPKLLDAAAEWSFDQKTRELMVWLPGCADPNKAAVRGKVRGFNLNATKSQMNLKDLTLFATTFGATNSGVSLLNVTMNCPTFNKRGIGECGPTGETWLHIDKRRSFRMENSSVFFSDGPSVFNRYGDNAVLTNNLFRGSCYAVGSSASLDDHNGPRGLLFERNTIEHFNCFTAITPGYDATIRLNRFRHQGSHTDGAGVHVHIGPQNGVVIEQNWFHDITNKALRFDRVNSPTATWGVNGTAIRNVWWRTGAAFFKGNNHTIENNTGFHSTDDETGALTVMMFDPNKTWSIKGENAGTVLRNNGADSIFNVSGALPGNPKTRANNLGNTDIAAQLTDPDKLNFVPKQGSKMAIDGVGAYRAGDASPWMPGCTPR